MEVHHPETSAALFDLLDLPKDGRMLSFGTNTALYALEVATRRPDVLIVVCDTTSGVTPMVSTRAVAEGLHNIVVGDTPAGPLVDRALCIDGIGEMPNGDLMTLRRAILPGGHAIFADSKIGANEIAERLLACGYERADPLESALPGHGVVRAR